MGGNVWTSPLRNEESWERGVQRIGCKRNRHLVPNSDLSAEKIHLTRRAPLSALLIGALFPRSGLLAPPGHPSTKESLGCNRRVSDKLNPCIETRRNGYRTFSIAENRTANQHTHPPAAFRQRCTYRMWTCEVDVMDVVDMKHEEGAAKSWASPVSSPLDGPS